MKRSFSLALSVLLLCSMLCMLGGCHKEDPQIIGTWQAEINYAAIINDIIYAADSMKDVGDYFKLDTFPLTTTFTFLDDGSYSVTIDAMEIYQSAQQIRNHMASGMNDYLADLIQKANLDISPSDYLAMMGINPITLGEQLLTTYTLGKISDQLSKEIHGHYRAEDGKLYMATDMDTELTDTNYDIYKIEGDTLTLSECHCHKDEGFKNIPRDLYPISLTRVAE